MDPILAEMFDTNGYAEKVAEVRENVEVFLKVANEEGVDLSGYTEDQIVEMANDLMKDDGYGYDGYPEGPDNLGPKTAEADWLGRYMAHAMWDEQEKIAAEGKVVTRGVTPQGFRLSKELPPPKVSPNHAQHTVVGPAEQGRAARRHAIREERAKGTSLIRRDPRGTDLSTLTHDKGPGRFKDMSRLQKLKTFGKKHWKGLAGGAVGAAALGAGAYALSRKSKEKQSHFELLEEYAVDRANMLLKHASDGYNVSMDEDMATDQTDFDRLVTERAWDLLETEGYLG